MQKETMEYFRDRDAIAGYSYVTEPKQLSKESILDFITEWSKKKNVKIFDYSLRRVDENFKNKYHYSSERDLSQEQCEELSKDKPAGVYPINFAMIYKIPKCDWVYYLDIYYQ